MSEFWKRVGKWPMMQEFIMALPLTLLVVALAVKLAGAHP